MYPRIRNMACDFKYLYGSLNLYSDQIFDAEYIIIRPNKFNNTTAIISNILSFFKISPTDILYYQY